MSVLAIDQLHSAPYGQPLLQGISLELAPGEVVGLLGPNGAGKSSLLHTIAGGLPGGERHVQLGGRPLADWSPLERARRLAMQTQHPSLNFPFSVAEVVLMGRIPHASGRDCDHTILEQVLAGTDTADLARRPYTQLSGGEKQRVQLARCVAQVWRKQDAPCRLLLLDEPSSALDLAHQRMVMDLVNTLSDSGCAVLMASHDVNLLASRCDRLLVLQSGRQHSYGTPADVLTPETFAAVFGAEVLVQPHPRRDTPMVLPL
jgi:iron complex transport system ATP-binding protein